MLVGFVVALPEFNAGECPSMVGSNNFSERLAELLIAMVLSILLSSALIGGSV